jgi:hypothetical protein
MKLVFGQQLNFQFEGRFIDIIVKEFGGLGLAEQMAQTWETQIAPKICSYVKKTSPEFYRTQNQQLDISTQALTMVPFLVRRLHRETKQSASYLIMKFEVSFHACIK